MKKTYTVVGALIRKDNYFFITQRTEGDPEAIYKWEFPGGTVEENELKEDALKRELMEEFKANITINKYLTNVKKEYQNKIIDIYFYECETDDEMIEQEDHMNSKWVLKDELDNFEFAPVDAEFVKFIKENY